MPSVELGGDPPPAGRITPRRRRQPELVRPPVSCSRLVDMIRLSVFYPTTEGATFDHDYYRDSHVPLAVKTWGLDGAEIDRGLDGPYVAAVHFRFASQDAMTRPCRPRAPAAIMADVANYTTITPVLQTSEIVA